MAKKQKNKNNSKKINAVKNIQINNNENLITDEIDESIAHQISIIEVLQQNNVSLEQKEEEEIKISPCVVLSSVDSDIKINGGFDFSSYAQKAKDGLAVFAKRTKRNNSNRSKERTSFSPQNSGGSPNKNNNKDKNKEVKAVKKTSNKDNIVYLKNKMSNTKMLRNMPANYLIFGIIAVIIAFVMIWAFTNKNANQVFVGDKLAGTIKEKNVTAEEIYNNAIAKLQTEKGVNVEVNEQISLKPVHASKKEVATLDYVLAEVCKNFTYQVEAAVITIDATPIAIVENKETADKLLDDIASKYITEGATVIEKSFAQDVKIESKFVNNSEIETNETVINKLTATTTEPKIHTVVSGDTLFGIAVNADMSLEDLFKANPGLTENSVLQLGQSINLVVPVPVLSVKIVEQVKYTENYNAETIVVENNQEYKTYEKVITQGSAGQREITANVTKLNGFEEAKTVVEEKTIVEPVAKRVERGTLQTPPKKAIGSFIYPVSGRLSSGFGARWGRSHKGIDLACSRGTPIYASDGGTVEFSGWNSGGYGYLVIINHGNGYVTYYGHNSKNAVSKGDKVYQGQLIGYVGSTGDSTGNHVHFEIRKSGVAQNPLNYL